MFFFSLFIILVSQSRESEAQTCSFLPIALPSFPLVSPLKKTLLYTPPFPHADGLESRKCYIEVGRRNRRRSSTSLSLRHIPDILQAMPLLLSLSFSLYLFLSATSRMLFKNASCKNLPVLRPLVITKAFFLLSSILSSFLFLLLLLLLNLLLSFGQCWSRSFILYIHILSTFDVFCQFQCLQSLQNQKNNIKMVYTSYKKSFV